MPGGGPNLIVGRGQELARVRAFLSHEQGTLLLEGEAGIGKTAVLRAVVDDARAEGLQVLQASPVEAEATFAFAGLSDLLRGDVNEVLDQLPPPQRSAIRVALLLETARPEPVNPHAVGAAVLTVFRALGGAAPTLVIVDDVQWLDAASAAALSFARRRLEDDRVAFLFTVRIPFEDSLVVARVTDRLRLGALAPAALYELLKQRLGLELARPLLLRLHSATGGNPLFAIELARSLPADRPPDAVLPVPPELKELFRARLSAVSPEVSARLAAAAAVVRPTEDMVGDVSEAITAGLVEREDGRIRFAHPLLASILYSELPLDQRRVLHRKLADVVSDPEQRAWHLARGAKEPDEEIAAALDAAAERATARGAPETAAELSTLAVRLTPPDRQDARARRALRSATYTWAAGDGAGSFRTLIELIDELPASVTRAQARQLLVKIVDDIPETLEQLESALEDASGDLAQQASVLNLFARQRVWGGDFHGAIADAQAAAALAERSGSAAELAVALAREAQARAAVGEPIAHELLERATALERELGNPIPVGDSPLRIKGACALWDDDLESALTCTQVVERRAANRSESWRAIVLNTLAEIELRRGKTAEAVRHVEEAEEIAGYWGVPHAEATVLGVGALVRAVAGDVDAARGAAERALALMRPAGYDVIVRSAERALGFLELSLGNVAEADAILEPLLARSGIGHPAATAAAPDEIEALIELGRVAEAEAVLAELASHVARTGRPRAAAALLRCEALVAAAHGELDDAVSRAEAALATHVQNSDPLERGRTLLVLGHVRRRSKQRRAARVALEASVAVFDEIGARLWAERARAELARVGGRIPHPDTLTPSERRVAELVAIGRSNPEVAQALFLSRKTVERHVSNILRKLDARNRTELSAKLRAEESKSAGSPR